MEVGVTGAAGERVAHLYRGKGREGRGGGVEVRMEGGVTGAAGE